MREDAVDKRLKFLNQGTVQKQIQENQLFETKIVKKILASVGITAKQEVITIDEIEQFNITLPVHLVMCNVLKEDMVMFFKDITKTKVWLEFFNIRESITEEQYTHVGIVFTSSGGGILICHDWGSGDLPRGVTRLQRLSADGEKIIVIEPFDGFLRSIPPMA